MTATLPRMNYRGAWSSSVAYAAEDVVTESGATYIAISQNQNSAPPSSHWAALGSGSQRSSISVSYISTPSISPYLTILELDNTTVRVARTRSGITETPSASGYYAATVSGSGLSGGDFIARWDEGVPTVFNQEIVTP